MEILYEVERQDKQGNWFPTFMYKVKSLEEAVKLMKAGRDNSPGTEYRLIKVTREIIG